ncbi:hypothetical protein [Cognatiyoonia sp. IB215182]|uniref:hypothetical protein n=1 Tax=Cognatiyoonia sp. IB215182 TaxID=3097353 RepID=UPI002A0DFD75|nr:hypothetical protein [Cognatiyoonia sp. IB215182]MDX8353662.1 hypothetical protein [Cognatiyoonia sp. IB215182]
MARWVKAVVAAGIVGTVGWAVREVQAREAAEGQGRVTPASGGSAGRVRPQDALQRFGDAFLRPVGGNAVQRPAQGHVRAARGSGNVEPLLSLIRKHESRGDYGAVWGRIARKDYPPRTLQTMTIGEVLAWQDSIDRKYNSEAAGAYQILEDTLRGLYKQAGLTLNDLFNRANQDRLAIALLRRRGLDRYRNGQITDVAFAQNLSKEWASLPAQTRDKRRRKATGQSYYAGDGLNKSLTTKAAVLAAVRKI